MDWGIQRLAFGSRMARHRHSEPHATLVLSGEYSEAGDEGRGRASTGTLILHRPFSGHFNTILRDTVVLNLPAPGRTVWSWAVCGDIDAIVRLAERDAVQAGVRAIAEATASEPQSLHWADALARAFLAEPNVNLGQWAAANGLGKEELSRGFKRLYGVSPKRYRAELRAYRAWRRLVETSQAASGIAVELGFADQPHMIRAVSALTGAPPSAWRLAHRCPLLPVQRT